MDSAEQLFTDLSIEWVDVLTDNGRELALRNGLERVPAYFFSRSIRDSTRVFDALKPILLEREDGFLIDPSLLEAPFEWQQ